MRTSKLGTTSPSRSSPSVLGKYSLVYASVPEGTDEAIIFADVFEAQGVWVAGECSSSEQVAVVDAEALRREGDEA